MADESESIGGINVNIGASHAQLPGDLAAADRIFEEYRARWTAPVQIRAQAVQPQQAVPVRPVAAQPAAAVSFGPGVQTRVQGQQAQTALQRAINAELSKTGEIFNSQTGEIESATKKYREQQQAVAAVREEAAQPAAIAIDTKPLQDDLQAVLATMREIAAEAKAIASTPVSSPSGGTSGGARRSGGLTEAQRRAANNLNALGSPSVQLSPIANASSTVGSPGYRSNEDIERSRQRASNVTPQQRASAVAAAARVEAQAAAAARREAFDQSQAQATAQAFAQSRRVRQFQVDEEQQARVVASRRAAITGSGRTSRTLASGLGALFGGTEQRQFEAQAAASQATRQLVSAERAIAPLDDRLRELARSWSGASGETRKFAAEQFKAIRGSDEYRGALANVSKAVKDDAEAQTQLNKISGASSVARNLVAITAAGAAFGAGLKVVDTVLAAIVPAIGNYLDIQTGFGATSTRVTTALGAQTLALHGNVDAALAAAEAQAGLSTSASDALNSQLRLTTQIKAGAQAQQQASELFRAGAGVGNAPTGLFGGYGGLGGTGLLAQQLGGGRGFSETIQQDFAGFQGKGGPDLLGNVNNGLAYLTNGDVRDTVNNAANQQGNPLGVAGRIPGGVGDFLSSLNPIGQNFLRPLDSSNGQPAGAPGGPPAVEPKISNEGIAYLNNLNDAAKRGAQSLGSASQATLKFTNNADEIATAVSAAAQAGDAYGVTLAEQQHIVVQLGNAVADSGDKYRKALEQFSTGAGIADPQQLARTALANERQRQREAAGNLDTIRAQQAYELPSQIGLVRRQTGYAIGTQQPAQAALGALANPNVPVGTGIALSDQGKLNGRLKEAQGLQDQLNAYYKQGQDVVENTYRPAIIQNFGQAAGQAFDAALSAVKSTGAQIAQIQAGISNEQAAYQVAQYNFQLLIAKRNLSDIGGLVGRNFGAGESELGVLERENLALSRQGQLLQFNLSQRQINFQTALAGFQAPGVTPEERQARIKEAQIEASYSQKQLDIQKQMFGNQVRIVDIGNLRQGVDLAKQIALLTQGRRVTLDTAAAEQRLLRLQQLQQRNVAQVSTYLTAVDNLAAAAFGRIQQLEAAYGGFLTGITTTMLSQVGIYINGLTDILSNGSGTGGGGGGGTRGGAPIPTASGGIFQTQGAIQFGNRVVGEAGGETVAILSHPRAMSMTGEGGGGGVTNIFNITGNTVRNDSDLDVLVSEVTRRLGREASLKGLRGIS